MINDTPPARQSYQERQEAVAFITCLLTLLVTQHGPTLRVQEHEDISGSRAADFDVGQRFVIAHQQSGAQFEVRVTPL